MSKFSVENLNLVLSEFLGNRKIVNVQTHPFTQPGDNFASDILSVNVNVENNDEVEHIEMVAKLLLRGTVIRELFNFPVFFRNEVKFYTSIVPELIRFSHQKIGENFDIFAQCFGASTSLDSSMDLADDNAIILLENLKKSGFECVDRFVSFDLATSQLVLETLATFHATTLALRLLDPEIFEKLNKCFPQYKPFNMEEMKFDLFLERLIKMVEEIGTLENYVPRVEKASKSCFNAFAKSRKNEPKYLNEPWVCIIHADSWVNNFMIKFNEGKPEKCKIIDWQLFEMGSPARDVISFIFTSIQPEIVKEYFYKLIAVYQKKFVEILSRFGVDAGKFNLDEFHKEIKTVVKSFEFLHIMIMIDPIFKPKEEAKALDDYTKDDFGGGESSDVQKQRRAFVIEEFAKLNFI